MISNLKSALFIGVVGGLLGANAYANTATMVFVSVDHPGTSVDTVDDGIDISPYTGTLGGAAVTLYCDDFNNDIIIGSTSTVSVTDLVGGDTSNSNSQTRFATADDAGSVTVADHGNAVVTMPSGTILYEELAWLYTQLGVQAEASRPNTAIEDAIQEAAWQMTTPASNDGVPTAYSNDVDDWIWLAQQDYSKTNNYSVTVGTGTGQYSLSIVDPNYSAWMILDGPNSALNAAETTGQQEQLAYYGNVVPSVPEPSAFGLAGIGSALLLGAIFTRSRRKR